MTDYDRDPVALAWARTKIKAYLDRLADFERQAIRNGDPVTVLACGISRQLTERRFLGGGPVIGVLDERLPTTPTGEDHA